MSENKEIQKDNDLKLLRTASSNYELALLKGLLEDNHIPYLEKDRGSGGYMRIYAGSSIYGTDIFVGPDYYEQAKAIMDEVDWDETGRVTEEELEEAAENTPSEE